MQENLLWGSEEAVGIQVLFSQLQDRRGKMIQEVAEEAGPERKGSAPPVDPPDGDTCRCPAPEPGPVLGKLKGREEEVLREGQKKK